jgi:membrane fusion protein, multidrug efflux system
MNYKMNIMNKIMNIFSAVAIAVLLVACGSGAKDKKGDVTDLKVEIEKLKKEKSTLDAEIKKLEADLAKADPKSALSLKLVTADTLRIQDFTHFIELQGKIDAEGIAYASPNGMGGQVKAVHVRLGQRVSRGQLLLSLDNAMAKQSVVAAQQQLGQLRTRLAQAQTIYEKQQSLWKQNIGAEIQVINAKADVDALAAQLRAAQAQIGLAQEQVNMGNVYAGISGTIDEMNVKPGEFFSASSSMQGMGIRIVNGNQLKMVTGVPENYIARVKKGDQVRIVVPESGRAYYESVISVVGASIDAKTRSFTTEAKLPADPLLKPNLTATLKIKDYEVKATIVVPVNVVQSDDKGKYVYVMEKAGDKMVARKKQVTVGEAYDGQMEIKSGLSGGEVIITEGYQTVYDGQGVTVGK